MEVGTRVVRGPDWDVNANEDGGEGFVGTVVEVGGKSSSLPENLVWVQWDSGTRHHHRAGYYGGYDLCVLDSASTGISHPGVYCEGCQEDPILGMRWHCIDCKGTSNLCTSCYMADKHNKNHKFERMERPNHQGIKLGVRLREKRIQAKGIFRGAKVKRGRDWKYDDRQDGGEGKEGVVKDITVWQHTPRSAVVVSWDEAGENKYRLCFKGKVDLTCVSPSVGFCYYKSHLPRFGEKPRKRAKNNETTNNADSKNTSSEKNAFVVGDDVLIDLSPGLLKSLTMKMCSWDEQMREYIGQVGEVHSFTRTGNVTISFDDGAVWTFPRNALAKRGGRSKAFNKSGNDRKESKDESSVRTTSSGSGQRRVAPKIASREEQRGRGLDISANGKRESRSQGTNDAPFKLGDVVRLLKDEDKVKRLQVGHGPWNQAVSECLGMVGRVMSVDSDGDVEVRIDGKTNVIVFNPATLCRPESTTEPKTLIKDAREAKSVESPRMLHDSQRSEPKPSTGDRKSPQQKQQQQQQRRNQEQKQHHHQQQQQKHQQHQEKQQQQQKQQEQQQQQQKQKHQQHQEKQQQQQKQQEQQQQQQKQKHQQHQEKPQQQQKQQPQQQKQQQEAAEIDPRERNELAKYLVANAAAGNESAVRAVLREKPQIIDCLSGGHTALHQACHGGHFDVATTLIGAGANLTPRDLSGYTALHHAAYGDYNGATTELLITFGADKEDEMNPAFDTPLHLAVEKHNSVSAVMLIKAGCDVNKKNMNGNTALHEAVRLGNTLIVEALLRVPSLDLKAVNKKGMNPFLMAVERKYKGAVAAMVKQSPEIVRVPQFETGMTALHYAAANDDAETVSLLLNTRKCDLDALNKKGVSAHEFAASMNKSSVAALLSRYRDALASGASFERVVLPGKVYREICIGDTVRLVDDPKTVEMLQVGHGGYNFQMSLVTGKLGTVAEVQPEGDVLVYFADLDVHFIMNPTVLELVMPLECDSHAQDCGASHGATPFVYTGEDTSPPPAVSSLHPMFELMLKMKSVLRPQHNQENDTVGMLFHAVVTNWKSRVRDILGALPGLVNSRVEERTPLHVACFDGSVEVAGMLLDAGAHLEAQDDCGFSPLHFSVFGDRSGETVELLVSHGAKIDANYNMHLANPVSTAVLRCNEAAVKILIQHGCDLNLQDGYGDTALHSAVRTEKDSITGMLLSSANINPNIYNNSGLNPLHMAVVYGNEAIVRKFVQGAPGLLEIPTADDFGRTALHLACVYNHPGVAEILLDTDLCDIHAVDATNRVPLSWASFNHMHSVVQRLLEMYDSENTTLAEACGGLAASGECGAGPSDDQSDAGAEPTNSGTFCQKLDLGDIVKVHPNLEVVVSLQEGLRDWTDQINKTLDRLGEVVTVESDGNVGVMVQGMKTAFSYNSASLKLVSKSMTSQSRKASAVTEKTNDVSQPTEADRENKEARKWQKASGKETTADESLEKGRAQPAKDDEEEEMVDVMVDHTQLGGMLLKSTAMGYVAKVKRFVQLNPDMIDYKPFGFSALHVACQDGFGDIIKILIQKGANKEIQDSAGLSPLQAAAVHDKSGVAAGTLLDFKVDPNAATADGRTPLHLAVLRDNEATAKVLVQRGCDVNLLDGEGNTALHHAVAHEKDRLVDVILEGASHDPLRSNKRGLNPLHVAAETGNEYATRKLMEHYPQMLNEPSSADGSTPLHLAASHKRREIVKALLGKENIELNLSNRNNKTALQLAEAEGEEDIVDLLAQSGATFAEFAEVSSGAVGSDKTTAENDKICEALGKSENSISQRQDKYHVLCNFDSPEGSKNSAETDNPPAVESPRWNEHASSENDGISKTNFTQDNEAPPKCMVRSFANDGLMHTNTESTMCEGDGANAYSSVSCNPDHSTGDAKCTPDVSSDKWTSLHTGCTADLESLKEDTRLCCDVILEQNKLDLNGKTDMESTKAQNSELSPLSRDKHSNRESEEDGRGDIADDMQRIDDVKYSFQSSDAEEQLNDDWYSSEEDNNHDGSDEITSSKDDDDVVARHERVSSSSEGNYRLPAGRKEHDLVNKDGESSDSGDSLHCTSREYGDNPSVCDEQPSPSTAAKEGSEFSEECRLCKQNPATVRYHPCGHTITCPSCASQISNCLLCDSPIMKKTIEELVRTQGEESHASLGYDKCCICWEYQKNVTFQCGHLCTCQVCSGKVDYCPFCAAKVQDRITTFY